MVFVEGASIQTIHTQELVLTLAIQSDKIQMLEAFLRKLVLVTGLIKI